jgi:DNA-binding SARP family transcriptional activator
MNFEVLGKVAAWHDGEKVELQRKQEIMLAVLVMGEGKPVSRDTLVRAFGWEDKKWEEKEPGYSNGLKRVASELRQRLKSALSSGAPLSEGDGSYSFPLAPGQADVQRFHAGHRAAELASGADRVDLLRKALAEWGADASGLYGGQPLLGLPGTWAEGQSEILRKEYRDDVLDCVRHVLDGGRPMVALQECDRLAADPEALGDVDFVEIWMLAAYRSAQGTRAGQIYRQHADFAKSRDGQKPSARLRDRMEQIRGEDPRLGTLERPADPPYALLREIPNLPAVAAASAPAVPNQEQSIMHGTVRSISQPASDERTTVSEPSITFNIGGTASVGSAIARNDGHVTINVGAATDPVVGVADGSEPDDEDREDS